MFFDGWRSIDAAAHVVRVPEIVLASVLAFIAGGIVLNVFEEDPPEQQESRPVPLLAGVARFASSLVAV